LNGAPIRSKHKWPVVTSEGVFDESELIPAHPSVIANASGRDLSQEAFLAGTEEREQTRVKRYEGLPFELRDEIENALKETTFEYNGHWRNGALLKDFKPLEHLFVSGDAMTAADAKDFLCAAKAKKPMDHWVPVDVSLALSSIRACSYCGEEGFGTETNGLVLRFTGKPCRFPEGLPPTEWELNVPSGKLVVANDLRRVFPLLEDDFDINTTRGCSQTALAYAAIGMSHAFVGNTCPGVFKCKDGSYKIANEPSGERWNGKKYVKVKVPKFDGENVAGICTDLWWYSICDQDEFERRCKHFKQKAKDFRTTVIDIKPGVYRFRHDEDARSHNGPEECVYTKFEWIRGPDPVKDYLASYESVDVNPNAYVQAQVARWPTLYGVVKRGPGRRETVTPWASMTEEERTHSWQRVADQTMCTIGGGIEWHEKGFPRAKVDPSVPDVEPPAFRAQHHWYPFSKPYGGLFEPKVLSPGFAKLAFRVLESVISFGLTVHDSNHSREVHPTRERMLLAVKRYRELAKKYPNEADPEYVAWLNDSGRAEAWVASFPLGPEFTEKHRKNAEAQRWMPKDAYAIAFDARLLKDGSFAWHPKTPSVGGCWANKKDAQRYALLEHGDNGQPGEHNCFWTSHTRNTSVPLYSVARIVKVGNVSHMGETLVELEFDYGTPWMRDAKKRKAVAESKEKAAITILSKEDYERLLPEAVKFFEDAEAAIKA
jgi:hypothetical protein